MADLCRARDEALHDLQTASPEPAGDLETAVFESDKPFGAMRSAERFLEDRGFAFGAAQRGAPRGVLLGAYHIRKWGDLSDDEKAALDGQMTGDMRYGPVTVRIKRDALSRAQWARVSNSRQEAKAKPTLSPAGPNTSETDRAKSRRTPCTATTVVALRADASAA